jgi:hypothetical protein
MTRHTGGCQCGAVRYEVDCEIDNAITCNCSRCQRLGSVLVFAPRGDFRLVRGKDNLTEYRFHTREIAHLFCKTCGIQSFAFGHLPDGTDMVGINLNCLDGVEPRQVPAIHFDGRSA